MTGPRKWLAVLALLQPAALTADDPIAILANQIRPSVVEVIGSIESSGETSYGTGFVVSERDLVLTNAHVLRGVKSVMVRTHEGALLASVDVLHQDEAVDLAVLRVTGLKAVPLAVAAGPLPAVGVRVATMGHPRGYEYTVSEGIVSALRALKEGGPQMIQTTAPISPGSSGGPLVDLSGRVIGVCSLTLAEGQNINFAVPASHIEAVVAQALEVEKALGAGDTRPLPAEALARLVRKHRESGDLTRAADLLRRALAGHPRSLPLLLEAAEVAWARASYKEVETLIDRMTEIEPGFAPTRQLRAALYAQHGRCEAAAGEARAALAGRLTPEQAAEAHAVLGECLGRLGQVGEALDHLDRALTADRVAQVPDYHALRAFLLQASGRAEEADREAITALELADWDPLVVAALRERGLPRLVEVQSQRMAQEGENTVVRGVVRNRGPVAVAEVTVTAEGRDASGAVVATGAAKVTPSKLMPGQAGSFRVVLDGGPTEVSEVAVRVIDFREP